MQITTDALVLKEHIVDDESRIVTLLTKNHGVIYAYIKGAKRLRSKLTSPTQLFCYSTFVLFKSKNRYSVNSADVHTMFFELTADIEKFTLVNYLAQLMIELAPEDENTPDYLRLMLNCLHLLKTNKKSVLFIKPLFELRVLVMAGYMPDLTACLHCACFAHKEMYFLPVHGTLVCGGCKQQSTGERMLQIDKGILTAMRHIIYAPFDKLFGFMLPEGALWRLGEVTQEFACTQLGKTFASLEMFCSLFPNGKAIGSN